MCFKVRINAFSSVRSSVVICLLPSLPSFSGGLLLEAASFLFFILGCDDVPAGPAVSAVHRALLPGSRVWGLESEQQAAPAPGHPATVSCECWETSPSQWRGIHSGLVLLY